MFEALQTNPQPPRNLMLGIAFGQGIALFLLWRALESEVWPSQTPVINFPLWTLALVGPTMLLLCLDKQSLSRSLRAVGLFSAIMALLAAHVGWQASPHGEFPIQFLLFVYVLTALIACFKGLMYCQQWIGKSPTSYAALFTYSWRNFLVAALAAALTGGVALILFLWGALFSVIDISFFSDLFSNDWFLFPVLAFAFGTGVLIFRRLIKVIDGITSLLEGLMRLLLPLVASVLVIFLGALPFTGLTPLWETGSGTALLLCLNAFALFFVNAVYQTGRALPYPSWVHLGLSAAIALLPIVSVLALYGLYLRVDEYGWTVLRCWAFAVFTILVLFSAGYTWCIVRWRSAWPRHLGRVNILMGWLVLATMILVNSPVLDFRSISLASQMQRVEAGEVDLRDFDYHYARHQLARPGYRQMQALIAEHENSDPGLVEIIRKAESHGRSDKTFDMLWANLTYRPEPYRPPPGLYDAASETTFGIAPDQYREPLMVRVDLNDDGDFEYVLLAKYNYHNDHNEFVDAVLIFRNEGTWSTMSLFASQDIPKGADLNDMLRDGEITVAPPRFNNLKLGDILFRQIY